MVFIIDILDILQQGTKETMIQPPPPQDGVEGGSPPSGTDG